MQIQTTVNPGKKAGKRYTKKELLALGWTEELVRQRLKAQTVKGKVFYRASEVTAAMKDSEFAAILNANLASRTARGKAMEAPWSLRSEWAERVIEALDKVFKADQLEPDVMAIASAWHELFMEAARQQAKKSGSELILKEDIIPRMAVCVRSRKDTESCARVWASAGRSAWQFYSSDSEDVLEAKEYLDTLVRMAEWELEKFRAHDVTDTVTDVLSNTSVREAYPRIHDLYYCYAACYVPEIISQDLTKLLAVDPKDEYPEARMMRREFQIHVGGTNTGKTYQSLQRLKGAKTGVYLAPLRLLALEVQERMLEDGVVCSMLTGEEEDIREGATHISSTVEKLDVRQEFDVAVIDECQMINDTLRGYAWTRAILGVRAKEIHLCVAPEGLSILKRLLKDLGEPYTVIEHKRKTPLIWEGRTVSPKNVQKGDAFVAFSKRRVLQIAETLRKNGIRASIIYGNLPYATRQRQMRMFLDGETSVLVATDAIGMGLNLPIRRVIFLEDRKYDGERVRQLRAAEVQQIAGRAGRFGIYDEGFAAAGPECKTHLSGLLHSFPEDVHAASLGFSDLVLKVDRPLIDVLRVWNQLPVKAPYQRMDISRHIFIINYIESLQGVDLSKEELLRASNMPFDEKDSSLIVMFGECLKAYISGASSLNVPVRDGHRLGDLELYYKKLDLYYSFSKTFGLIWNKDWLMEEKQQVAEEINYLLLHELKKKGASCRKCGGPLDLFSRHGMCDQCYWDMEFGQLA